MVKTRDSLGRFIKTESLNTQINVNRALSMKSIAFILLMIFLLAPWIIALVRNNAFSNVSLKLYDLYINYFECNCNPEQIKNNF